jgi:antirestriction protein ArdC
MSDTGNTPAPSGEGAKRKPFHQEFAEKIIESLKEGSAPWQKPWHPGSAISAPHNPVSGTVYRGVNRLSLALSRYDDPRWMTFNQAKTQGYSIKEGSMSEPVVYFQWTKEETVRDEKGRPIQDKDGKEQKLVTELDKPIMRVARVFNAEQIIGIPPMQLTDKSFAWNPIDKGESILAASGANINHDQGDRAFYRIRDDSIHLPPKENFEEPGGYYGTALHELGHWTRHPSRLNRESGPFGTEQYAREELRAEIASWMLAQDTGIPHDPGQHTAYVESWIEALEKDPFEIQRACRDAEKIRDYLLELELRKEKGLDAPAPEPLPDREESIAAMSLPERPAPEKTFLSVPYKMKDQAKGLGAKWDKEAKSWFAPQGTDLAKLRDWLPVEDVRVFAFRGIDKPELEGKFSAQMQKAGLWSHINNVDGKIILFGKEEDARAFAKCFLPQQPELTSPAPVLSPQAEFDKALHKAGLDLQGQAPILDGEIYRVPLLSGNEAGGAYCAYGGEQPYGWSQNFQTGEKTPWIATGHVLSEEKITEILRESEQRRQELAPDQTVEKAREQDAPALETPAEKPLEKTWKRLRRKSASRAGGRKRAGKGGCLYETPYC